MFKRQNRVFQTVYDHLSDSTVQWSVTDYELVNATFGYTIWIANGRNFYALYRPVKYEFTFDEKTKMHELIRSKMEQFFFNLVEPKVIDATKVSIITKVIEWVMK